MKSFGPILTIVGSVLLAGLISLIGYESYHAYMINHTYYYTMLADSNNRKIIVGFIVLACLPLGILLFSGSLSIKKLGRATVGSLLLSGFVHTTYKGGLIGSTGVFLFLFNMIILFSLIGIFFGGVYAIGSKLYTHFFKHSLQNWSDILLSLGLGLGLFLLVNYILLLIQAFYPIIARIQLLGLGCSIRYFRSVFIDTSNIINPIIQKFQQYETNWKIVYSILIVITLLYMMFSFNLSYIPYSTAWDANHAYMYFPKIRSLNNGVFYSDGPVTFPYLWMVYISYWFSLLKPLSSFTIAPDTLAVFMNSLSGRLSLLFGLGALKKVIGFFQSADDKNTIQSTHIGFSLGWMYFLLWLMSGMGAFLVFVDNKTDLGVMSLTMLAIMTGFIFLEKVLSKENKINLSLYGIISGLFFALAVMAKPTAFQDVLIFGLLLVGLWVGIAGLLGGFLMVLGVLGRAETMSIVFYINKSLATKLGIAGLLTAIGQGIVTFKKKSFERIRPLLYRASTIIILLIVFKGGFIATQQIISHTRDLQTFTKGILLGKSHTNKTVALLADSGNTITIQSLSGSTIISPTIKPNLCTLGQANLTKENLYDNLSAVQGGGLIEDLGRYIGFGQRTFSDSESRPAQESRNYSFVRLGYPLLRIFFHNTGCYSFNTTADQLCENKDLGKSSSGLQLLINQTDNESNQYKFLSGILEQYNLLSQEKDSNRQQSLQSDIQKSITDYVQGNVIEVTKDVNNKLSISIPYAYLTPLNVIFNRSLQNLSSYYTDIGFIWILSLVLLIAGTIYSIYKREEKLLILHIVTLCGWIIWWFIASGIIRYAVGIIAWTLFCNVLYLNRLLQESQKNSIIQWSGRVIVAVIIFTAIIQTILNSFRIASQGGSGPFTWYKGSTGKDNIFIFTNQGIQQKEVITTNYNAQDVFNVQFGHYNNFINYTKNRKDQDGILIAGTYIQYFLINQNNLYSDGLLGAFWQWGSDENSCNLALRLQDKKIKYLVIDPNIGSVVMGGGNASLFDRFVAKIDSKTNKIIKHGTMTMLAKMIQEGYLKLIMTNNMGAKYAYTLTDTELQSAIQSIPYEDTKNKLIAAFQTEPLLFRSKLAVPRFFGDESQQYFVLIGAIFQQRLGQAVGLEDLSDILGKVTDNKKLSLALQTLKTPGSNLTTLNKQLSEDERAVMGYYTAIDGRLQANDTKGAQEIITQLLQASLGGGSQLMTFELQI